MTQRASLPSEIFLSHSSGDHRFADKLAAALRAHHVPVWYSSTNLVGAQQWHDEIGAALARCDWFIVVLSPGAVKSEWVKRVLCYALNDPRYTNGSSRSCTATASRTSFRGRSDNFNR